MQSGLTGAIYRISDWVMRLAYLNLLWITFTLIGFGLFGFFPATIGMFSVCRKWVMGEEEVPVFKTFFHNYKREFRKGNLLGVCLAAILYILWRDYRILQTVAEGNLQTLSYFFFLLFISFGIFLLFLFPLYVHYDLKVIQLVKNTFLIAIVSPLTTIVMVTGVLFVYYVTLAISGIILFFSGSALALFLMWCSYRALQKLNGKLPKNKVITILAEVNDLKGGGKM